MNSTTSDLLARRYGTNTSAVRQRPVLVALITTVVMLLGAGAAGWWMYGGQEAHVYHVGYTVDSPSQVTVRFSVNAPEGSTVRCSLRAVNHQFAEVGLREVVYEDFPGGTQNFTETMTTTEEAETGHAQSCQTAD